MTHEEMCAKLSLLLGKKVTTADRDYSLMNWLARDSNGDVYLFHQRPICSPSENEWLPTEPDNNYYWEYDKPKETKGGTEDKTKRPAVEGEGFYMIGNFTTTSKEEWYDSLKYVGGDAETAAEYEANPEYESYE